MEENMAKFEEKLKELVALGKKKKSVLELQEINDFFSDMELTSEQMEKVYDYLEANNVDVLRIGTDDDDDIDDADIVISDEDEVDMEKIDLSVPDGISIEDPVRMYLKEIGKVPLLTADEEVELAKRMADGDEWAKKRLAEVRANDVEELRKKAEENGLAVTLEDSARSELVKRTVERNEGARPISPLLEEHVALPLAELRIRNITHMAVKIGFARGRFFCQEDALETC